MSYKAARPFGLIGFLVLPLLWFLLVPLHARAEIYTCGVGGNWFDGYVHSDATNDQYEGAGSYIRIEYGAVCDAPDHTTNNFTNAWAMIAAGDGNGWVQSGFERSYGGSIHHFAQTYNASNSLQTTYGTVVPGIGSTHSYRETWYNACLCVKAFVDGQVSLASNFNPFGVWVQPFTPQYLGETRYRESDIAGTSSAPTYYSSESIQRYSDDAIVANDCGMSGVNDSSRWARTASNCTSQEMWTK